MVKKKKETLIDATKDTIKLGIVSGVGLGAVGAIAPLAGPAAGPAVAATSAGVGLANVGRMAKTGMTVANMFEDNLKVKGGLKKSNKTENKITKKLWG